jgi:hypothetical protein
MNPHRLLSGVHCTSPREERLAFLKRQLTFQYLIRLCSGKLNHIILHCLHPMNFPFYDESPAFQEFRRLLGRSESESPEQRQSMS